MAIVSIWNMAGGTSVTKELNFSFYFILSHFILSSYMWLVATIWDNAGLSHLLGEANLSSDFTARSQRCRPGVKGTFQSWGEAFHQWQVKAKRGQGWSVPAGGAGLKGASHLSPNPCQLGFPTLLPSQPRDTRKVLNPAARKRSDRAKLIQPESTWQFGSLVESLL